MNGLNILVDGYADCDALENHAAKQDDKPDEAKQSLSQLFRSRGIRRAIALQVYAWMVDNSLAAGA